ncbi:hypothetical protein PG994_010423 [Apiospora phragmitis]|uniref:Uncharacterized protein n=1 Tax=Apiospora phragmitis TaxID=2905665 RepID=A0ABR1TSI4_9PEZI
MTGMRLSRWARLARAPRLDHANASIRGIGSNSSSNSQKILTSATFSRGAASNRNFQAGSLPELPEPTLFGNGELSERFDSSAEIAAFFRSQRVAPAHNMWSIKIPKARIAGITMQVCSRHCVDFNHMKYLDNVEHPMRKTIIDMYTGWADRPLWYSGVGHGAKPIVNSKAKRWIQRGIREALRERGYDRDGQVERRDGSRAGGKAPPPLYGTLKVQSHVPVVLCRHTFPQVLEAMRQALDAAEPHLIGDGNKSWATRRPGQKQGLRHGNGNSSGKSSKSPKDFKKPPPRRRGVAALI